MTQTQNCLHLLKVCHVLNKLIKGQTTRSSRLWCEWLRSPPIGPQRVIAKSTRRCHEIKYIAGVPSPPRRTRTRPTPLAYAVVAAVRLAGTHTHFHIPCCCKHDNKTRQHSQHSTAGTVASAHAHCQTTARASRVSDTADAACVLQWDALLSVVGAAADGCFGQSLKSMIRASGGATPNVEVRAGHIWTHCGLTESSARAWAGLREHMQLQSTPRLSLGLPHVVSLQLHG